jgi:hypothetical protein
VVSVGSLILLDAAQRIADWLEVEAQGLIPD